MEMLEIARSGLKGRKKDTLLLKIVITLSFVFIVASTIFEASIDKTKLEQRLDLYGEWHAAYLDADEETVERLKLEKNIDKIAISQIIGESDNCGVIGTFDNKLLEMGRFSIYKGRIPEKDNEIMVELNQMSNMGLELEVGQTVEVAITIPVLDRSPAQYILDLNKKFYEEGIRPHMLKQHDTPYEHVGDVLVVFVNDYVYYYPYNHIDKISPDVIRRDGFLKKQKVIMKKEFIVTGIIQTYTDKWDLGGYPAPNAFITKEGADTFINAFYNNSMFDMSNYEMGYNVFLYSDTLGENMYDAIKGKYPNREYPEEESKYLEDGEIYWSRLYGKKDEEIQQAVKSIDKWNVDIQKYDEADSNIEGPAKSMEESEINLNNFRKNNFSYPKYAGSTEYVLTLTIIAVIFIATALAIFQIFLTQMKRRSRRIVLLKSIGATNGQIVKMLLYEGLYLLKSGLMIGVPTGFLLSALIVLGMNILGGRNLQFFIYPKLLILGILAGCFALFVGMTVPAMYAVRIPLVGTMSKPPKHVKIRKSKKITVVRPQNFRRINWRYFTLNKGKSLISFGISLITITVMLTTILLCYFSFDTYIDTVIANSRPDYVMETYFGEMISDLPIKAEEIKSIGGITEVEVYKVGKQTFLWYEGIENNELFNRFYKLLPNTLLNNHFSRYKESQSNLPEYIKNAFLTKYYGIDPNSQVFNRFIFAVDEGTIDKNKFKKGEQVILLVPLYFPIDEDSENTSITEEQILSATTDNNRMKWILENSNSYKLTYNSRYSKYYLKQNYVKPGDIIYLSSDNELVSESSSSASFTTIEVEVGGIIYYFDREGPWPFSNTVAPYIVIGSYKGMENLYPNSRLGLFQQTLESMKVTVNVLSPTKYGRTIWHIKTNFRGVDPIVDAKLLAYANKNGYTLYNYKDSNFQLYTEGFNNALIIGLLGFTAVSIAFVILYNTIISRMEQDRNRIGILQSIGVSRAQFLKHYFIVGVINGLVALIVANIGIFIVLFLTNISTIEGLSLSFKDYIYDIVNYRLWLYPWWIHFMASIIFFITTVLIYYLPGKRVTELYPIENIRSLAR